MKNNFPDLNKIKVAAMSELKPSSATTKFFKKIRLEDIGLIHDSSRDYVVLTKNNYDDLIRQLQLQLTQDSSKLDQGLRVIADIAANNDLQAKGEPGLNQQMNPWDSKASDDPWAKAVRDESVSDDAQDK